MTELKAVIFDIGGVLVSSPVQSIRQFEESTGLESGALRPLFASNEGAWSRFEKSELSPAEFVNIFQDDCEQLGFSIDGTAFLASFFGALNPREEMLAVARHLKGRVKLGCITNNVARDDGSEERSGPLALDELFDVVIESSKVGLRKPDPEIYLLACRELGVEPEEAAFLDDFGVNLKAARALGMTTIKVDETPGAIDELEEALGMELPRAVST